MDDGSDWIDERGERRKNLPMSLWLLPEAASTLPPEEVPFTPSWRPSAAAVSVAASCGGIFETAFYFYFYFFSRPFSREQETFTLVDKSATGSVGPSLAGEEKP